MSPSRPTPRPPSPWLAACAALAALAFAGAAAAQGALFPEPFVVEHHLVQVDDDGSRFESETVTDYYGGSWIVSVRADGSRTIVDLARREVSEVRPEQGTWWTVSFDRLAELRERLYLAEHPFTAAPNGTTAARTTAAARAAAADEPAELVIEELPVAGAAAAAARTAPGGPVAPGAPAADGEAPAAAPRPSLRLRVVAADRAEDPRAGVEVWLDPRVRLRPAALEAIAGFEAGVLGEPRAARREAESGDETGAAGTARASSRGGGDGVGRQLAAARAHAAGALPVRTVRTLVSPHGGTATARIEDVATRLETIPELPRELVAIPEGLRRVPHPIEAVVAFLEGDAERDRAMSRPAGGGR